MDYFCHMKSKISESKVKTMKKSKMRGRGEETIGWLGGMWGGLGPLWTDQGSLLFLYLYIKKKSLNRP